MCAGTHCLFLFTAQNCHQNILQVWFVHGYSTGTFFGNWLDYRKLQCYQKLKNNLPLNFYHFSSDSCRGAKFLQNVWNFFTSKRNLRSISLSKHKKILKFANILSNKFKIFASLNYAWEDGGRVKIKQFLLLIRKFNKNLGTYFLLSMWYCGLRIINNLGRICIKTLLTHGAMTCVVGDRKWIFNTTTVTQILKKKKKNHNYYTFSRIWGAK